MEEGKILILEFGKKPLDLSFLDEKCFYERSGDYIKITCKNQKIIKKLKDLGFVEIQS